MFIYIHLFVDVITNWRMYFTCVVQLIIKNDDIFLAQKQLKWENVTQVPVTTSEKIWYRKNVTIKASTCKSWATRKSLVKTCVASWTSRNKDLRHFYTLPAFCELQNTIQSTFVCYLSSIYPWFGIYFSSLLHSLNK